MDVSIMKLYSSLIDEGFNVAVESFLEAYSRAHMKYRVVRYGNLREVTNAVWVAEALNAAGYEKVNSEDVRVKAALNVFFKNFIDSFRLRAGAVKLFEQAAACGRVGLLSNFTYAPVVYFSLNQLGVSGYFNSVVVSEAHGWRKPSQHIFRDILERLQVKANETLFIGDSPLEDIKGAKEAGLRTIFVESQFYSLKDLITSNVTAEFTAKNLRKVSEILSQIIKQ
jgi:HAD superfamily hydrolase (TIGR01549 family)